MRSNHQYSPLLGQKWQSGKESNRKQIKSRGEEKRWQTIFTTTTTLLKLNIEDSYLEYFIAQ